MAKLQLTSGFTLIPEGEYTFRIYGVDYKERLGQMAVYFITADGLTHRENFRFLKADGSVNEGAMNVFSFMAKTALDDFSRSEIDETELVGTYLKGEITHDIRPNQNDPTKTVTFVHLKTLGTAEGFDTEPAPGVMEKTLLNVAPVKNVVKKAEPVDVASLSDLL